MSELDIDTVLQLRGATVRDRDGEKIGTLGDVFLDRETDRPAWVGVRTGLFGAKQSYVSLAAATVSGGEVQLPYEKELVKDAPHVDPDVTLDPAEEEALYRHYGEAYADPGTATTGEPAVATGGLGDGDDVMIRSEEEIRLEPGERRPYERVRIKKVTVTEHVREVVPIRREVIQLEHEPAPSGTIESVEDLPDDHPRDGIA